MPVLKGVATIIGIAALCGVAYFIGGYSTQFDDGICYSEVIHGVAGHAQRAIELAGREQSRQFMEFVESLPVRGYETDCDELRSAIEARKSVAPGR